MKVSHGLDEALRSAWGAVSQEHSEWKELCLLDLGGLILFRVSLSAAWEFRVGHEKSERWEPRRISLNEMQAPTEAINETLRGLLRSAACSLLPILGDGEVHQHHWARLPFAEGIGCFCGERVGGQEFVLARSQLPPENRRDLAMCAERALSARPILNAIFGGAQEKS